MTAFAKWLHVVSLALWFGTIAFFSFVVAPSVFGALPRADAGRVVSAIFPIYYQVGYACGLGLIASALYLQRVSAKRALAWRVTVVLAAIMLGATLYAGLVVQPRAHDLRASLQDASSPPALREEFDRLHRRAVQLNGAVLIGALIVSAIVASRLRTED